MSSKKTVLIIQPILAHYRNSLFYLLADSAKFDIHIIAGKNMGKIREINPGNFKIQANLVNKQIRVGIHNFIWQSGAVTYARKLKPDIIVLTGVDLHLLSNLFLAIFNKVYFQSKIIWWGHASLNPTEKMANMLRKFFFNLGSGIFTYSEAGKKHMQSVVRNSVSISVIKNCINTEEYGFDTIENKSHNHNQFTILFSGRITREKRLDILIDAIAILKTKNVILNCFIIGEGPLKAAAEKQALKLDITDQVIFVGERYANESRQYFSQAEIFVLPGKVGLSIIHGLSYGLPVLTSDKVEIHSPEYEIIQAGCNGDFFSDFNPESLADKIIEWEHIIKKSRETIVQNCIDSVKNGGYTPAKMSEKMIGLFSKISSG